MNYDYAAIGLAGCGAIVAIVGIIEALKVDPNRIIGFLTPK